MRILLSLLLSLSGTYALASDTPKSLDALIEQVKQAQTDQNKVNREREAAFKSKLEEQDALMKQAKKELAKQKELSETLKSSFERQESELVALEKKLELTMGTLGEMYGVVRQVAADTFSSFETSITSFQNKDRLDFLKSISGKKQLASTEQLKQLWLELLSDMNKSGQVVKFNGDVTLANGQTEARDIVRVGTFNMVSDGKYLHYLPETGQVTVLKRQPSSTALSQASSLVSGEAELNNFTVDPTRGVLLSKMVNAPTLSERVAQGGVVGYVILGVLFLGMIIVIERVVRLRKIKGQIDQQMSSKEVMPGNPLGKIFSIYKSNNDTDVDSLEIKLHEAILKTVSPLEKGISTVKILAAIAPLLGLLGTVTGMIGTFQSITLFGTGDPKLMAGGISQALVTTVLGLVAAIPLILLHSFVAGRCKKVSSVLEEQAAGLLVERIEAREA
jgi:biopolymer transport protein ExbB